MQAITQDRYGSPDVLSLRTVDRPTPAADEVLVRVVAASVNPYDWHMIRGLPYVMRLMFGRRVPKNPIPGADFAGIVEMVGADVTGFSVGDEVFGGTGTGTLAEYVAVAQRNVVHKPSNVTFEQASGVAMTGITALQALRNAGKLVPGQHVLVNGASGGVGSMAVQIAKALGAEVTAVCSTRNVETLTSIGADHVIDYTEADFVAGGVAYDLIVDVVGNRTMKELRTVLARDGRYVGLGQAEMGDWIGPFTFLGKVKLGSVGHSQSMKVITARNSKDDFLVLEQMLANGDILPVIDREYPLAKAADAVRYLEEGHARGKVIVKVSPPSS
jgi:NADPH:quinone reductase-like Zn-dependent oxidoreductase